MYALDVYETRANVAITHYPVNMPAYQYLLHRIRYSIVLQASMSYGNMARSSISRGFYRTNWGLTARLPHLSHKSD